MKKSTLFITIISVLIILTIIKFPTEIRFQNPYYNYLFVMSLFILLPISIFIKIYSSQNKLMWVLISLPILFFSSIIILFITSDLSDINTYSIDPSFELTKQVEYNNTLYKLYRTNGGATTDYGLILMKENNLPLGLKLTKILWEQYHENNATLELIQPNKLKLEIQPYSTHKKVNSIEFKLDN